MSKATGSGRKPLAFLTALMVVLALAIPFAGAAVAGHNTSHDLDCRPETDQNQTGTQHEVFCQVTGITGTETTEVDAELAGPNDPDGAFSPTSPDFTQSCAQGGSDAGTDPDNPFTLGAGDAANTCTVVFRWTGTNTGTDTLTAWIDDDQNNTTFDADAGELRDEAAAGGGGNVTDPDDTDVVEKNWFGALPAGATLDCDDEQGTNETGTASSTGSDTQVNPAGQSETYTCTVTRAPQGSETTRQPIAGVRVDVEQEGANDPDNRDFNVGANTTPDRNDACTTDAQGRCTIVIPAQDNELGDATICFWADFDNDNQFDDGGEQIDGGDCDTEAFNVDDNDLTDVVAKSWQTAQAAQLDAEPEVDNNASGTQHTVTATVTDQFGNPVANSPVDFLVTGRNGAVAPKCDNVATNNQGVAVCTYQDAGTTTTSGQDTICAFVDPTDADSNADCTVETRAAEDADLVDVVTKFWTVGGPPAAGQVRLDMNQEDLAVAACDDFDETATNSVATTHSVCARVTDAAGNPIPGKEVTFTITGPGNFTNADGTADSGQTVTVTADESGEARATIESDATGTSTVTATADNQSDTGTKTWTTAPAGARNVDCDPDTATNEPGTEHVITCTVTDRFGNPVPGVTLSLTETGPGRFQTGGGTQTTDANGQVEVVVTTTVNEEGDQTIRAEITSNRTAGANNDPCEQPAGTTTAAEPGGAGTNQDPAPAGNCVDTVTKTWGPTGPQPECSDGVDNDGDGLVDFPADEGCESAADDDESDFPEQEFGGEEGQPVTEGACTGFLTGSVQANPNGDGIVVVGTNGPDALQGTDGADLICALGDDDAVQGHGGNDTIYGGGGKDGIEAGAGDDTVFGEGDKDIILGDAGNDELDGGQGNDNMGGGDGADVLLGRGGWDTLKGNADNDLLVGAKGRDILQGGGGNDTARGGADDDVLKGFVGRDLLRGGGGDDIIKGSRGRDRLIGNAGDDFLHGGPGRDRCRGGRGNDVTRSCP